MNDAAVAMFEGADKQELIVNKAAIYTDRTVESLAAMLDAIWRGQPSVTLETVAVTLKIALFDSSHNVRFPPTTTVPILPGSLWR